MWKDAWREGKFVLCEIHIVNGGGGVVSYKKNKILKIVMHYNGNIGFLFNNNFITILISYKFLLKI